MEYPINPFLRGSPQNQGGDARPPNFRIWILPLTGLFTDCCCFLRSVSNILFGRAKMEYDTEITLVGFDRITSKMLTSKFWFSRGLNANMKTNRTPSVTQNTARHTEHRQSRRTPPVTPNTDSHTYHRSHTDAAPLKDTQPLKDSQPIKDTHRV